MIDFPAMMEFKKQRQENLWGIFETLLGKEKFNKSITPKPKIFWIWKDDTKSLLTAILTQEDGSVQ